MRFRLADRLAPIFAVLLLCAPATLFGQETDDEDEADDLEGVEVSDTEASGEKMERLREIRSSMEDEPSIDEVQQAALEFYGVGEGRIKELSSQASLKNLAPKVSAQYRRNQLDTSVNKFDYKIFQDEPVGLDEVQGNVDEFVVAATWNLPKLIYNPEQLELASLRKIRERVLKEVTRLYYLRRRLKIGFLLEPPRDVSSRLRKRIRIKQTTAMINSMTDGVFGSPDD